MVELTKASAVAVRAERCETCRHAASPHKDSAGEQTVECRRYPPVSAQGQFPRVGLAVWCGEWKASGAAKK